MSETPTVARAAVPAARPYRPPAPIPHAQRLGPVQLLLALRRNPVETWGVWHFEEPVVPATTVMGETITISDPTLIRHVLVDNVGNYPKDDLQRRVLAPGLGEGLLTAEGDVWRRARRTLAPLFAPRTVESFAATMEARAAKLVNRLSEKPDGAMIDVDKEMTRVTFDILAGTLFSDGIVSGADRFGAAVTRYFNTVGRLDPLDAIGAPDWIPRIGRLQGRPAIRFFEEEVGRIIRRRAAELAAGRAPHDLLTLLMQAADPETGIGLTDAEVAANIVTFIGAGHETTANTLSWTLFLLAKHPETRARVEAEAAARHGIPLAEWPERLPWTRAAIEEAMRLYPPAATLTRGALKDDRLGDVRIRAGTFVVISPYVVHRHKRLWREPDRFRPERFLPGVRETVDRYQYIPFGAGPRICIGARFAMLEAVIVLATLAATLRFDWPQGRRVMPLQRVTLRPDPGLTMRMTRVQPARAAAM